MKLKNDLFLYLSQIRFFYQAIDVIKRWRFRITRSFYGVRHYVKETVQKIQFSRSVFIKTVWINLFYSILFALLFQLIDPFVYPYIQKFIKIPDDGDYVTFLVTVSGIGGIFIGLYYAAIVSVGSAMFANVPNNVRDLLAAERSGNVYMGFLSFLTVFGLVLVAFRVLGLPRIHLVIPVITVLAGIGIFAFVNLGKRAFNLFDPALLSLHIIEVLQLQLKAVRAGGFQWLDKSFQNHAFLQASEALNTLETLAEITSKERHLNGKPYIALSQNLLDFLTRYEAAKGSIPTNSAWYEQRLQHHDWYRAGEFQTAIALETGTVPQPEVIRNKIWLENRILPILSKCIMVNLKEGRYSEIQGLFPSINRYVKFLARKGEVNRAFEVVNDLNSTILNQITVQPDTGIQNNEHLEKVALIELLCIVSISIVLGHRERTEAFDREQVENQVASVRWDNKADIYQKGFPYYLLAKLEWLQPKLQFEKETEDKYITPPWYSSELLRQIEAERFMINTQDLLVMGASFYDKAISKANSCKRPWIVAAAMSREREYWLKVEYQIGLWEEHWNELNADRRIEDLTWPTFDPGVMRATIKVQLRHLTESMSEQSLHLAPLSRLDGGFPDFAGNFLHISGEGVFDSLLNNDTEFLQNVFSNYLVGSLRMYKKLSPQNTSVDFRVQQDFRIAMSVLLDLMDISGYAKLMTDYYRNEKLWNTVTTIWNSRAENAEVSIPHTLIAVVQYTESDVLHIAQREDVRYKWKQRITEKLQDVPRNKNYISSYRIHETVIDHDSPLIRVFANDDHLSGGSDFNGIDVFLNYYLKQMHEFDNLHSSSKRLQDEIAREENRDT